MTSEDLKVTQKTLEAMAKAEIDEPMTNYTRVRRLLKVIDEVDTLRRETWNKEKFGVYEEIAEETLNVIQADFTADDIPF